MDDLVTREALTRLARSAVDAMLSRDDVVITHSANWTRPRGWPLPCKKIVQGLQQHYRPMAVLEYVEHALRFGGGDDWSDLV